MKSRRVSRDLPALLPVAAAAIFAAAFSRRGAKAVQVASSTFELWALGAHLGPTRLAADIVDIVVIAGILVSLLRSEKTGRLAQRLQRME